MEKADFNVTTLSVCPHFLLEIGRHIFMKLCMNIMGFETNLIPYFPFPIRHHINMAVCKFLRWELEKEITTWRSCKNAFRFYFVGDIQM